VTIEEMLKSHDIGARVSVADRWMYWEHYTNQWVVQVRPMFKKNNRCLYSGSSLDEAIAALEARNE